MFVLPWCCYNNEGINYSQTQLVYNIYVDQLILQNNERRKERKRSESREKLKSITPVSTVTCGTRYMDNFHIHTVHLDIINFFSPTDAQVNCLKKNLKFTLKLTLKQLRHVSVQSRHHQGAHYSCLLKLQLLK